MQIVVEPSSFYFAKSGAVVGAIWLRLDGPPSAFPQAGWTDFPVVILGWWLREIEALVRKASVEATCKFMDGPFEFVLSSSGNLRMRERRGAGVTELEASPCRVSVQECWESLNLAALNVVAECDARGWSSRDIDTLCRFMT